MIEEAPLHLSDIFLVFEMEGADVNFLFIYIRHYVSYTPSSLPLCRNVGRTMRNENLNWRTDVHLSSSKDKLQSCRCSTSTLNLLLLPTRSMPEQVMTMKTRPFMGKKLPRKNLSFHLVAEWPDLDSHNMLSQRLSDLLFTDKSLEEITTSTKCW